MDCLRSEEGFWERGLAFHFREQDGGNYSSGVKGNALRIVEMEYFCSGGAQKRLNRLQST